jgi:hypothetical protein
MHEIHLNDDWKFCSNLRNNILHLHYEEHPANEVQVNIFSLSWGSYETNKYAE